IPLINKEIPIIADTAVEKDFGTGALKITPAHDPVDFEIGQRHSLPLITLIDLSGKMINVPREIEGLYPKQARSKTIELLEKEGKLLKTEPLTHTVGICYRCKNLIEPLLIPQWFVKIKPLAGPAIEAVKSGKTKIFPLRFKKIYLDWMENIRDWNISRQIVWGPQIPAWYCLDCNPEIKINFLDKDSKLVSGFYKDLKGSYSFEEIKNGLQSLIAPVSANYLTEEKESCPACSGSHLLQETDTFDTWFLSGQWPLTTLGFDVKNPENSSGDFKYFYPTSVMDTLWDILFFWVGRMMMFGLFLAKEVPFKVVHIHSRVVDKYGQKMSKSKGNVIDPIVMSEKYGADALRMSLVYGIAPASDIAVSEDKIKAMRNFANKVWNVGRFILGKMEEKDLKKEGGLPSFSKNMAGLSEEDKKIIKDFETVSEKVTSLIEKYHFGLAAETIYEFIWHRFADQYVEYSKERIKTKDLTIFSVLTHVYLNSLKLLHPFMPFLTESIWQIFPKEEDSPLVISSWPKIK
ncbi:class I tRNA ligase family protein, partial [Patescibacteria group bacterium]|nr:class I tRNA ligase family protein [Patescibacteria group bacterium]